MPKKKVVKKTVTTTEEIVEERLNEKTQIVCILDRSASMDNIIEEAIGGFNEFIKKQKELEDEATMTVALFDDQYELLYDNVNIKDVELFNRNSWSPRGLTALFDAVGKTINTVDDTHKKMKKDEVPEKVLVCIVTDGMENSSNEFNANSIKKLISKYEEKGWSFIYLAANQDAFDVGTSFGISGGNTYTFTADGTGAQNVSSTLDNATTYYRSTYSANLNSDTLMDDLGVKDEE